MALIDKVGINYSSVVPNRLTPSRWRRLLILSEEGPNLRTAGGIVLYRLLNGYPEDSLVVIEHNADPQRGQLHCRYHSLTAPWLRLEQSRFHRWKRSLRGFGLVPDVRPETIQDLLAGFRPEIVLCVMERAAYYEAAWIYARALDLPLIVIVHDVHDQFEPVLPIARKAVLQRDAAFYRYAKRRLCVSPELEALCADLYGVRGEVMYPNRSEDLQPRPFELAGRLKCATALTVGFAGNLNYGYGDELLRLLPAFRASGSRLVIFGRPPGPSCAELLHAPDCVEFRGFMQSPLQVWAAIQSDCDAVLLAYPNPAGAMERLYRNHFPSKLPEYLALGMPVIVTGPDYATGLKWARCHPEAVASYSGADIEGVARLFKRLRDLGVIRVALAKAAFEAGNRDFDPAAIRAHFLKALETSCTS